MIMIIMVIMYINIDFSCNLVMLYLQLLSRERSS